MERKNDSTILLLVAAGLGIYWFMKNKSLPPATTPITAQPVLEQPIVIAPTPEVISQPAAIEYTPVMDMFNSVATGGGLENNANQNIVPIDNINLSPKSALSDQYL